MRGKSSPFLDRVEETAPLHDRDRLADGVRAVFYALFGAVEDDELEGVAKLLPSELETLWKPAYFQLLRDAGAPAPPPALAAGEADDPVEVVRQRAAPLSREEAETLTAAVLGALRDELNGSEWDRFARSLPRGVDRLVA